MKRLLLLTSLWFLATGFVQVSASTTSEKGSPFSRPAGQFEFDVTPPEPAALGGVDTKQTFWARSMTGKDPLQGWPSPDGDSQPMLTGARENPLFTSIAITLLLGSLARLLTSPAVRRFFASIYDPLNW